MSHLKTLSWTQEAPFCQELTDAWAEALGSVWGQSPGYGDVQIRQSWLYSVGNLCCVSVSTQENKKNPSGEVTQRKATIGYRDFHSDLFPFMESHAPFNIFHLLNDNIGDNVST